MYILLNIVLTNLNTIPPGKRCFLALQHFQVTFIHSKQSYPKFYNYNVSASFYLVHIIILIVVLQERGHSKWE